MKKIVPSVLLIIAAALSLFCMLIRGLYRALRHWHPVRDARRELAIWADEWDFAIHGIDRQQERFIAAMRAHNSNVQFVGKDSNEHRD